MTQGFRRAWLWRRAYWDRVAPRRLGILVLGLLPLLFFLPLENVSVFGERTRGTAILIWLFSLSLAFALRGGEELRTEASIWAYQKGFCLGELALQDWILDLGLFFVAAFWWASVGVLAMDAAGPSALFSWTALFSLALFTAGLAHAVTFCFSALGVRRPSDPTVLLALTSLLVPALALRAPSWIRELMVFTLPPFRAAVELHGSLRIGQLDGAAGPLLHLFLFVGLTLWIGFGGISNWRPKA